MLLQMHFTFCSSLVKLQSSILLLVSCKNCPGARFLSLSPSHCRESLLSAMQVWAGGGRVVGVSGAGDVVGVSDGSGLSEKVSEDGLEPPEDGGNELRVPVGEPSDDQVTGWSVVAMLLAWQSVFLVHECGSLCRKPCVACLYGLEVGVVMLIRGFSWDLGSGYWDAEKICVKRDSLLLKQSNRTKQDQRTYIASSTVTSVGTYLQLNQVLPILFSTKMVIAGHTGRILKFWLQILNHLEIWVQKIYRSAHIMLLWVNLILGLEYQNSYNVSSVATAWLESRKPNKPSRIEAEPSCCNSFGYDGLALA